MDDDGLWRMDEITIIRHVNDCELKGIEIFSFMT